MPIPRKRKTKLQKGDTVEIRFGERKGQTGVVTGITDDPAWREPVVSVKVLEPRSTLYYPSYLKKKRIKDVS